MLRRHLELLLSPILLLMAHASVTGGEDQEYRKRWSDMVLEEREVLSPLLDILANGNKANWPAARKRLKALLTKAPRSRFADDIELILAYNAAILDRDAEAALASYTRIAQRYPKGKSILNITPFGRIMLPDNPQYLVDHTFTIQGRRMLRKELHKQHLEGLAFAERAFLRYFWHLEKYPRSTKDYVTPRILHLRHIGDLGTKIEAYQQFLKKNHERMVAFNKADRAAAKEEDGFFVHGLERPLEYAFWDLGMVYQFLKKDVDGAIRVTKTYVDAVSPDGWHYQMNLRLAGLYQKKYGNPSARAVKQYKIALRGYLELMKKEVKHMRYCGYALSVSGASAMYVPLRVTRWPPRVEKAWETTVKWITEQARMAGGDIEFDVDGEIAKLRAWFEKGKSVDVARQGRAKAGGQAATRQGGPVSAVPPAALSKAVKENDLGLLVRWAEHGSEQPSLIAIEALGKTAEGRVSLTKLLVKGGHRRHAMLRALQQAATPDVIVHLRKLLETAKDPDVLEEVLEALCKSMPDKEARAFCLRQSQKLAARPDVAPRRLILLLRGLGPDYDPPEVRVLRKILRKTKTKELRVTCLLVLSKWITATAESREDVLRILKQHRADKEVMVRAACSRAFGLSGDVRSLRLLEPLLKDTEEPVRRTAARAVCDILAWEFDAPANAQHFDRWVRDLRVRLAPVLEKLAELEKAAEEGRKRPNKDKDRTR